MRMSFDPRHVGAEGESRSLLRDETRQDAGCWATASTVENGARPRCAYLTLSSLVIGLVSVCVVSTTTWSLARHRFHARRGGGAWPTLPQHCDGVDFSKDVQFTTAESARLANSTFVSGFWRSRHSHHPSLDYALRLRQAACRFGWRKLNVIYVQDSAEMCESLIQWYTAGRNASNNAQLLGRGRVHCEIKPVSAFPIVMTKCPTTHSRIWLNKVPILSEIVSKVESGVITREMKALHYFGLDGDVDYMAELIEAPLKKRYFGEQGEEAEGKLWTKCYNGTELMPSPVPVYSQCPWLRLEVMADVFGGPAHAVMEYAQAYTTYVNAHFPTKRNRSRPPEHQRCVCPREEHVMTTMSRDPNYQHLYSENSCARNWRA